MLIDLITKNRSYRRFYQEEKVLLETLYEVINLARLTPSGANLQSLKYVLTNEEEKNEKVFQTLKWAGYLTDWDGPEEGEKPSAYIIMLHDTRISKNYFWDHGLAAQSILLGLVEKGLGACQFNNIDRPRLASELGLPDYFQILLVMAVGKPKEIVVLEEMNDPGQVKYWRDEQGVHHVPKRKLEDLIVEV